MCASEARRFLVPGGYADLRLLSRVARLAARGSPRGGDIDQVFAAAGGALQPDQILQADDLHQQVLSELDGLATTLEVRVTRRAGGCGQDVQGVRRSCRM